MGAIASTYDYAGNLATETLTPPNKSALSVIANVQMGPFGPSSYQLGNGLYQVHQYNANGQMDRGWVCSGTVQPGCSGGGSLYGWGTSPRGSQLVNSSDSILNNYNNYAYDSFNRLTGLNGGSGGLSLSWSYDIYGNRLQQNASGTGSAPQPNYSVNAANNQITAYTYDAAGEVNYDGSNGYYALKARCESKRAIVALGHTLLKTIHAVLSAKRAYREDALPPESSRDQERAQHYIRCLKKLGYNTLAVE